MTHFHALDAPSLRQLEYVIAVAEERSFSGAAIRCGVSQPALSKQIQLIEEMLGLLIFERTRPHIRVTSKGEAIVVKARDVLDASWGLMRTAREARALPALVGELHLGVIPTIAPYFLPEVFSALRTHHPSLTCILHEDRTDTLLDHLSNGQLDAALLALPIEDHGLVGADLYDEAFMLVAPTDHPLSKGGAVGLDELRGERMILMEEGHCFREHALEVCNVAGALAHTKVRAASVSTLIRMVASGVGATLIPVSALATEIAAVPGIVARPFHDDEVPTRRIVLRWRATSARGEDMRALCDLFRTHASRLDVVRVIE